jgi:hypothetical protein
MTIMAARKCEVREQIKVCLAVCDDRQLPLERLAVADVAQARRVRAGRRTTRTAPSRRH